MFSIKDGENMKFSSIKIGMKYSEARREIIKSENLIIRNLPTFCNSNYMGGFWHDGGYLTMPN